MTDGASATQCADARSAEYRCTEFTTEHGLSPTKASDVFGAAISE